MKKNNKITLSLVAAITALVAIMCMAIGCVPKNPSTSTGGGSSSQGDAESEITIELLQQTATVAEFETIKLKAYVTLTDDPVSWSSSDQSIATVDQDGTVHGIKSGSCEIIASVADKIAKCALTVTPTDYAPEVKFVGNITIELGKTFTTDFKVMFKGEDVTADSVTEWTVAEDSTANCKIKAEGKKVTLTAESLGTAKYFVSATYNGIYVNKSFTVTVTEATANLVPDSDDVVMGDNGFELTLYTLTSAGNTELPVSFTVYQGDVVTSNAVIAWNTSDAEYNASIAAISGENGNYTVKKVGAGSTTLTGTYTDLNGKLVPVTLNITVKRATQILDFAPVIEVEDLKTITLPSDVSGTVEEVLLNGKNILSAQSGNAITLNKAALPKKAAELGERELTVVTKDVEYVLTAEIYSLVISNKSDFDKMRTIARSNWNNEKGVLDGYFVLDSDIEYNGKFTSMTNTGELWQLNNSGWNNPSAYGFKGVFDGRGYTVNGLTIAANGNESGGIFAYMNNAGVVKNVTFTNAGMDENTGFICSYGGGLIENVSVSYKYVGVGNENRYLATAGDPRWMGTFYSCGASESATVRNCFVDAINADIKLVINKERADLSNIRLGTKAANVENFIVVCNDAQADKILSESGATATAKSYSGLSESAEVAAALEGFNADVWTILANIPMLKSAAASIDNGATVDFVGLANSITIGSSTSIKTNLPYTEITVEGLYDGVTYENGVLSVAEGAASGTVTVKAVYVINGSEKVVDIEIAATQKVAVPHERVLIEVSEKSLDLSFASAYLGDSATVAYKELILGDGALNNGKLSVDLSGITATDNLTFTVTSKKGDVYNTFDLNVRLATKVIRSAEDLEAVRIMQTNIDTKTSINGLFVLANDIDLTGKIYERGLTYNTSETVAIWESNFGFRGTFDGQNYKLSNATVGVNGIFGHIGRGALIKNVTFANVTYKAGYLSALLAGTLRHATLDNVTVTVKAYTQTGGGVEHSQGLLASRYMQYNTISNVKIDASGFTVYSVFGRTVVDNVMSGCELKIGSFTVLGFNGDATTDANKITELAGLTITNA